MARRAVVLGTVCAIGGAVVGALLMVRGQDAENSRMAALQRRLDALESRVALSQGSSGVPGTIALGDHRAPPPATRDHDAEKLASARGAAAPDEPATASFMDPAAAAERRSHEAGVIEQTLAAEPIDVAASNTFAAGLKQAFGDETDLAGNQLLDAECRATLCRIAVLHRSDDDVDMFLGHLGTLPGFDNTQTYWRRQLNADGSSVMTMYVARQGQRLPDYQMHADEGVANPR